MYIERLLKLIDDALPVETAFEGDRIGLQVQGGREEVNNILVAFELNDEVIDEAATRQCDCIIAFHPLIYTPLTEITDCDRVGRLCSKLILNSIALISIHTTFDSFSQGTSNILAEKLGFKFIDFLIPDKIFSERGIGVIAKPDIPISGSELLERIYSICKSPVRYGGGFEGKTIEKIAIVGGSGSSFIDDALNSGAQAFITADISYHKFHYVFGKMLLIDAGHFETEQFVPQGLGELLKEKLPETEYKTIIISNVNTNPVRYYPETEKYIKMQKELSTNKSMV